MLIGANVEQKNRRFRVDSFFILFENLKQIGGEGNAFRIGPICYEVAKQDRRY